VQVLSKRWTNLTNSEQTNRHCCTKSAHGKLCFGISAPLCKPIAFKSSNITGVLQGPTWQKSRAGAVLLANRRYDGSRSRKTKGSLADTFQCNIWRRAQTPHRLTHCLHGGDNHAKHNGFTALSKTIGTSKSTESDSDYVLEHSVLKYLRKKIACCSM